MITGFQAGVMGAYGGLWTPANITTALWLDAADITTITKDGSNLVSQWNDKSGNSRHHAQSNSTYRPLFTANNLNNLPVISFDGTNDCLENANSEALKNISSFSLIVVAYYASQSLSVDRTLFFASTNTTFTRFLVQATYVTNKYRCGGRRADTDSFGSVDSNSNRAVGIIIQSGNIDYSNASATVFVNGSLEGVNNAFKAPGNTSDTISAYTSVGGDRIAAYFNGYIAEIVGYLSVDVTTRQKLEGYLAHKWGLTALIPSSHPYRYSPPTV